jgi:endonuclease/exonuclease/phosphatase family metal-dependent hydrolase
MKNILVIFLLIFFANAAMAGDNATDGAKDLRILTYNIKMLPRYIRRTHHYPIIRARIIPAYITEENPDIIVFQEAFDTRADRILRKRLHTKYPHILGPVNKKPGFKINGGVMIFSKYPLKQIGAIQYSRCSDEDCWARKGVLLAEVNDGKHIFQLAGTHMNGGGTLDLKKSQYREMGALVKQYAQPGIPQILAGDYNTNFYEKPFYDAMIQSLDAQDGPLTGAEGFTDDHLQNDMEDYDPKDRKVIDFVLYRPNGVQPKSISRTIRQYCCQWAKNHCDLSDHYAVLMDLKW